MRGIALRRQAFRLAIWQNLKLYETLRRNSPHTYNHHAQLESLEPRHLMAAIPIARDDAAFYTNVGTDLVVTTSSTPAHLLANDLDIDGGSIASSVVTNPTSGSLIAFENAKTGQVSLIVREAGLHEYCFSSLATISSNCDCLVVLKSITGGSRLF